ncbi:DUF642 domain-containing protein [Undibacterium sp.]|jgi:hypothetical protein|uniref:DUF642 domain-containing protein n=1 Tax=Undibacterium sp. TaxID=1914977 RepID=UPI002C819E92|nr:DUF642 domain-containing protein [Undibacterium sp.]HTD02197.1 DUF642 domain-containing protein [Undibacterium sp.]
MFSKYEELSRGTPLGQKIEQELYLMKIKSILAMTVLLAAGAANANLITNGNFESGKLTPWNGSGNVSLVSAKGGDFWFGGGSAAQDGVYAIAFNSGDKAPDGVLWQTFATQAGLTYTVSFDYGTSRGGSQSLLTSILGGDGVAALANMTATASNTDHQPLITYNFSFVADGSQSTLRFADSRQNSTGSLDGILDNVSVVSAVPEPASLALLCIGMAGLGFGRRKKA